MSQLADLKDNFSLQQDNLAGGWSSHGDGKRRHTRLRGGWRETYNVSRLNGSIVLSGKGRDVRPGELLNPPC